MNENTHRSLLQKVAKAVTKLGQVGIGVPNATEDPEEEERDKVKQPQLRRSQQNFPYSYRGHTLNVHTDEGGGHRAHISKKNVVRHVTKRHPDPMRAVADAKMWINENATPRTLLMPNASPEAKARDVEQSDREYRQQTKGKPRKDLTNYTVGDFLKRKKGQFYPGDLGLYCENCGKSDKEAEIGDYLEHGVLCEDCAKQIVPPEWHDKAMGHGNVATVNFPNEPNPKMPKIGQEERPMIEWTPDKLTRFEAEYERAINGHTDTFVFDGHEFVVPYAKYLIEYLKTRLRQGQILTNPEDPSVVDATKGVEKLRQQALEIQQKILKLQSQAQAYVDALANKAAKQAKIPSGGGLMGLQQEATRLQSELNEKLKALPQNFIKFSDGVTVAKVQVARLNDPAWKQMIDTARIRGAGVMQKVTQILDNLSGLFQKLTVDIQLKEFGPNEFNEETQSDLTDKNTQNVKKIDQYQQNQKDIAPRAQKYFVNDATGRMGVPGT